MNIRGFTSFPPSLSLLSFSPATVVSPSHPPPPPPQPPWRSPSLLSSLLPHRRTVCPLIPYNSLRSSSLQQYPCLLFFLLLAATSRFSASIVRRQFSPSYTPTHSRFLLEHTGHIKRITIRIHVFCYSLSVFVPFLLTTSFYSHSRTCRTFFHFNP